MSLVPTLGASRDRWECFHQAVIERVLWDGMPLTIQIASDRVSNALPVGRGAPFTSEEILPKLDQNFTIEVENALICAKRH